MVFDDQQRIRAQYDLDWFNHLFKLAGTKMNGYRFIFSEKGIVQNIIFLFILFKMAVCYFELNVEQENLFFNDSNGNSLWGR